MERRQLVLIVALVGVLVLLMIILSGGRDRFNWRENFEQDNENPYGTYVISTLLKSYFPGENFYEFNDSIPNDFSRNKENSNYVFIGEAMYMDSADVQGLLAFVNTGNTAFISSKTIPYDLMFYLYYEECYDYYWDDYSMQADTLMKFNLIHENLAAPKSYEYSYLYKNKIQSYSWHYIDSEYFCDEELSLVALGQMNDSLVNFARVQYGEGQFYLHTSPIAFTNIQLLDETGIGYANKVFSHLAEGSIYWDNYSQVPESVGRRRNQENNYFGGNRTITSKGPLQYILEQPPLAWAWYILLSMSLLYLLFRAKRTQRIIPVLEKNTNTSLEFISTIGRLYFLQNNHRKLALQKIFLFKAFVRQRYGIQAKSADDEYLHKLINKSEVEKDLVDKIFLLDKNISDSSFVSENTLIDFHKLLDQFYRTCK